MVKFVGKHPIVEWIKTGCYSLDLATRKNFSLIGWPTRTYAEVCGPTGIGKSTFINSVACILAQKLDVGISCLDLEMQDPQTIEAICNTLNYEGEWKWPEPDKRKKDAMSDENMLAILRKEASNNYITILDSVASISPISEVEGNIGDTNWGRRAFNMAQFSRLMCRELRFAEKGVVSFLANHLYDSQEAPAGGLAFAKKKVSPGGEVKENLAFLTFICKRAYHNKKELSFGDVWIFEGKVKKNRHGPRNETFWVAILGGRGIHLDLTAMFDCVKLGMANIASGNKLVIKDTGEDLGRISEIIAKRDELSERGFFEQFYDLTRLHQLSSADDAQLQNEEEQESEEDE